MSTWVKNPNYPDNDYTFTLAPRDAVIAAYALFTARTANSWEWESRFGHLATQAVNGRWTCGDWCDCTPNKGNRP